LLNSSLSFIYFYTTHSLIQSQIKSLFNTTICATPRCMPCVTSRSRFGTCSRVDPTFQLIGSPSPRPSVRRGQQPSSQYLFSTAAPPQLPQKNLFHGRTNSENPQHDFRYHRYPPICPYRANCSLPGCLRWSVPGISVVDG
jgi:hypothetical protein